MQIFKMNGFVFSVTIFVLTLSFSGCDKDKSYLIEEKDGVTLVHNKFTEFEKSPVSLQFIRQIGETDSKDETTWFAQPLDLVVDSEGSIFILDMGMNHIKKYDSAGNYVKTIGQKGQGPGEFESIMKMEIDEIDNIYVIDIYGRVQVFDNDGNYLHEFRIQNFTIFFKVLGDSHLVINKVFNEGNKNLLHFTDRSGDIQSSFCEMETCQEPLGLRYLNGITFCTDAHNNIYVAFRSQNRIEKYSTKGKLQFCADRPLNYDIHFRQDGFETLNAGGSPLKIPKWDYSHVSRDIDVDYNNRLWVITFQKQPEGMPSPEDIPKMLEFEIFSADGILMCKLPFPDESFDSMRIFGKRLFFIDPQERVCVREYEIVEQGA
ncbi:MAG: NHL repeat-containing protein [Candidatus Zhuqueibacterota bacterium]